MNEVLTTIKERRSIRRFKTEQITNKELNYILEAGLYAPSAHNQQSWHFTVVQSKKVIEELNSGTKKAFANAEDEQIRGLSTNRKFNIFYDAPTVVIISGDQNCMMPQADCGAATQNMLLAAESLNVGGCWNGYIAYLFNDEIGKPYIQSLNLPDGQKPYYAIALGYKGVDKLKAPPRKENRIHYIRD